MIGGALSGASGLLCDSPKRRDRKSKEFMDSQIAAMEREWLGGKQRQSLARIGAGFAGELYGFEVFSGPRYTEEEKANIRRQQMIAEQMLTKTHEKKAKMSFKQKLEIETRDWLKGALD